jgi:hypothetical protein
VNSSVATSSTNLRGWPLPALAYYNAAKGDQTWFNTRTHCLEPVGPIAHSDGHDFPWLIDEFVPGVATVVDDFLVRIEDPV